MKTILRIVFKGLIVVVPVGITLYVLWWLGSLAETLLGPPVRWLLPADGPMRYRVGMGVVLGTVAVFVIGLLTYTFIFRKLMAWLEALLERIPLVKSVYGSLRDLMDLVSRTREMAGLNQVVAIELEGNLRLLGFVTQPKPEHIPRPLTDGEDRVAVYLPMSYQLGGYTVFVERSRLRPVDMNIEDGMRYALTAAMSAESKQADTDAPKPQPAAKGLDRDTLRG